MSTMFKLVMALSAALLLSLAFGLTMHRKVGVQGAEIARLTQAAQRAQETRKRDEAISTRAREKNRATARLGASVSLSVRAAASAVPAWADQAVPKEVQDALP